MGLTKWMHALRRNRLADARSRTKQYTFEVPSDQVLDAFVVRRRRILASGGRRERDKVCELGVRDMRVAHFFVVISIVERLDRLNAGFVNKEVPEIILLIRRSDTLLGSCLTGSVG